MPKHQIEFRIEKGNPDLAVVEATLVSVVEFLRKPRFVRQGTDLSGRYCSKFGSSARDCFDSFSGYLQKGNLEPLRISATGEASGSVHTLEEISDRYDAQRYRAEAKELQGKLLLLIKFEKEQPYDANVGVQTFERWESVAYIPIDILIPQGFPAYELQTTEPASAPAIAGY